MPDLSVDDQRRGLLSWLEKRGEARSATLRETHDSLLAFTEDRVWKCKKAVRFPFIDLSTLERRRVNCEREVLLNRRLAPDVYLGVVPLTVDGEIVDYLVEMRRQPDDCRLSTIVGRGAHAGEDCVDAIADLLVRFHARAPTGSAIDSAATPSALQTLWTRSIEEVRAAPSGILDSATIDRVEREALTYVAGRAPLFRARITERRIRDGHGDLLADDMFCLREGPQILDCLEFDDVLRFGDVLGDVAFLAMDLESVLRPDLASRLLQRYRSESGDNWPLSLEHFYIGYRALVRNKVACLRVADDAFATTRARALLALADAHLAQGRVRLVLIGGAPATGKTTIARELARVRGWIVLHSDVTRKQLAGLAPSTFATAPLGHGLYSPSWTDRTYTALLDQARTLLAHGEAVILDASWSANDHRHDAEALAAATSSTLSSFACEVPSQIADQRAAARIQRGTDASDADASIAAALRSRFDPWPEAVVLDATEAPARVARRILAELELL